MATTAEAFVEDADPSGTHRSGNSHGFSLSHRERTRVSPFPAGCDTDSRASAATRSLDGSLSAEGDRVPRRLVEPAHRLSLFFWHIPGRVSIFANCLSMSTQNTWKSIWVSCASYWSRSFLWRQLGPMLPPFSSVLACARRSHSSMHAFWIINWKRATASH